MLFNYLGYEVSSILPNTWKEQILEVAKNDTIYKKLSRTPITSREEINIGLLSRGRVSGEIVAKKLLWLHELYHTKFLELASKFTNEKVYCAKDIRYGIVLNVARGNKMRFECHVDSNPLECLLFCTNHPFGTGGELVVSNNSYAVGINEVNKNCSKIYPSSGQLIFFDARQYPHYVKPLLKAEDIRIVAAMNFYTESCPETTRPPEINKYLFGEN